MFKVKLASGETFPATAAEQSCNAMDFTGNSRLSLRVEASPADHDLEWYLEKLNAPKALDTVEVLAGDDSPGLTVESYTEIVGISIRLLATGDRAMSLTLCKPVEVQTGEV